MGRMTATWLLIAAAALPTIGLAQESSKVAALRARAERGEAGAQVELGDAYKSGDGVPKDFAKAAGWFRKGADQGDPRAQCNLAVCYDSGGGGQKDQAGGGKKVPKAAGEGGAAPR